MAARVRRPTRGKHPVRAWAAVSVAGALLWPTLVSPAAIGTIPVVSRITGEVLVKSATGVSHNLTSVEPLKSPESLTTGPDALASVSLEGVGKVRIGPSSAATVVASSDALSLDLRSGSLCARADTKTVAVTMGNVEVTTATPSTIFDVMNGPSGLTVAVFSGSVSVSGATTELVTNAGHAFVINREGNGQRVPFSGVLAGFASLSCPDPEVVASASALSAPQGGGGGGGILGVLLGLGAIAAFLAGHGGGGGSGSSTPTPTPNPSPTPTPAPGVLTVTPMSLTFKGSAQTQPVMVSESNYSGSFTVTSGDLTVATVSGSGNGPGPVTFNVMSVAPGNTTLTVTDNHSGMQSVTVTVEGPLTVSTNSVAIVGLANTMQFTASESFYAGPIGAASSNPGVATVSGGGTGPGPVAFTVTPVAVGNANIQVTDDHGGSQIVVVSITVGSLTVNPITLSFSSPTDSPQQFNAIDSAADFSTIWSATSSNAAIATVTPASQVGDSPTTFTVTPAGTGQATITVNDDNGTAVVSVGVGVSPLSRARRTLQPAPATPRVVEPRPAPRPNQALPALGRLMLSATNLTFSGPAQTQTLSASESGYGGPINAVVLGSAIVALDHQNGPGPAQIFRLSSQSAGTALVRIFDDHGNAAIVSVTVKSPASATPPSLQRPLPIPLPRESRRPAPSPAPREP